MCHSARAMRVVILVVLLGLVGGIAAAAPDVACLNAIDAMAELETPEPEPDASDAIVATAEHEVRVAHGAMPAPDGVAPSCSWSRVPPVPPPER